MKRYKILPLILCLCLLVCICACNNKSQNHVNNNSPNSPQSSDSIQNSSSDSAQDGTSDSTQDGVTNDSATPPDDNQTPPLEKPPVEQAPPEETPPTPQSVTYVKSKVNGLAIRQKPTTASQVLGQINAGDMVLRLNKENGWYKTYYLGQTAYISASQSYTTLVQLDLTDDTTEQVILTATKYLGTKYVYGATRLHNGKGVLNKGFTTSAFDCSSFTQYAYYYGANINLGLTTRNQVLQGTTVDRNNLSRGDLMFFTNSSRKNLTGIERVGHVAIYLGDNYILHTATDYAVIEQISSLRWSYYITSKRYI